MPGRSAGLPAFPAAAPAPRRALASTSSPSGRPGRCREPEPAWPGGIVNLARRDNAFSAGPGFDRPRGAGYGALHDEVRTAHRDPDLPRAPRGGLLLRGRDGPRPPNGGRRKHCFLSRPRRFGKGLFVDTCKELFEGNEPLFRGFAVHDRRDWPVRRPVVRLDFSAGDFDDPDSLREDVAAPLDAVEEVAGIESRYSSGPARFRRPAGVGFGRKERSVAAFAVERARAGPARAGQLSPGCTPLLPPLPREPRSRAESSGRCSPGAASCSRRSGSSP